MVAIDEGIFKKHGLEIEELPIRDTLTAGVQSLLGVDLLIGFGNPLAVLQPVAHGRAADSRGRLALPPGLDGRALVGDQPDPESDR